MGLFDNPLEHCEKNAQWETVTEAVDPNDLVRCKRSDVEQLHSESEALHTKCARYEAALDEITDKAEHSRYSASTELADIVNIARRAREGKSK